MTGLTYTQEQNRQGREILQYTREASQRELAQPEYKGLFRGFQGTWRESDKVKPPTRRYNPHYGTPTGMNAMDRQLLVKQIKLAEAQKLAFEQNRYKAGEQIIALINGRQLRKH